MLYKKIFCFITMLFFITFVFSASNFDKKIDYPVDGDFSNFKIPENQTSRVNSQYDHTQYQNNMVLKLKFITKFEKAKKILNDLKILCEYDFVSESDDIRIKNINLSSKIKCKSRIEKSIEYIKKCEIYLLGNTKEELDHNLSLVDLDTEKECMMDKNDEQSLEKKSLCLSEIDRTKKSRLKFFLIEKYNNMKIKDYSNTLEQFQVLEDLIIDDNNTNLNCLKIEKQEYSEKNKNDSQMKEPIEDVINNFPLIPDQVFPLDSRDYSRSALEVDEYGLTEKDYDERFKELENEITNINKTEWKEIKLNHSTKNILKRANAIKLKDKKIMYNKKIELHIQDDNIAANENNISSKNFFSDIYDETISNYNISKENFLKLNPDIIQAKYICNTASLYCVIRNLKKIMKEFRFLEINMITAEYRSLSENISNSLGCKDKKKFIDNNEKSSKKIDLHDLGDF